MSVYACIPCPTAGLRTVPWHHIPPSSQASASRAAPGLQRIAEAMPRQYQVNTILKAKFILRTVSKTWKCLTKLFFYSWIPATHSKMWILLKECTTRWTWWDVDVENLSYVKRLRVVFTSSYWTTVVSANRNSLPSRLVLSFKTYQGKCHHSNSKWSWLLQRILW